MFRRLTLAAALATATTLPAAALDLEAMSDADRDAFRAEVRAYLLENPEVLMEAIAVLEERQAEAQVEVDREMARVNMEALHNDPTSWVGGNLEGDLTLVEFVDYRRGFCRRAHPEVAELIATDGNIRIITKEYPILGEQSLLASRFALAVKQIAGDDTYKAVSDTLMTMRADVTEASLTEIATQFGLDTDAVLVEMNSPTVNQIIVDNRALGQRLQINGTPTFVLEDEMLRGYVPLDQMRVIVEAKRAEG